MNDVCPILIIEDDPSSQRLLEKTLKAAGYHVVSSQNGLEALEVLEKNFFQIVITDWEMPGMNGLEVCRSIRSRNYEWHVYIIILTVTDSKDDIVAGLEARADDYVTKPFHRAELLAKLQVIDRYLSMEKSLRLANEKIKFLAISDPLTGLYNRSYLMERLPQEINRARRYRHPLSVILCDIDHFKMINDSYGHRTGDRILKEVVEVMQGAVRNGVDWMARYGGEEFLIIMPETDIDGACKACERLRELISDRSFNICSESIHVTASFGVSSFDPSGNNDRILPETLIDQSDKRMYTAKKLGRNRVEGEVP